MPRKQRQEESASVQRKVASETSICAWLVESAGTELCMIETWCEEQAGGQNANFPAPPVLARPAKTSGVFSCDEGFFLSLITPSLSPESTMRVSSFKVLLKEAHVHGQETSASVAYLRGLLSLQGGRLGACY